jgi:hypothetical protein
VTGQVRGTGIEERSRGLVELGAVALLLCGLTIWVTWPQVRHLTAGVIDWGDPLLNSWTLAWVAHTLPAHPSQLLNANIFYPERGTLAYSEMLLVPGLLVAPVLWLGGDPILAHNLLLLASYVLSGLATYVLVRSLVPSRGASLVAAVVFTVYPYRIEQYPKVQLQLTWWIPLALWAAHRLGAEATIRRGLLVGLLAALQTYSCLYYGVFAIVPLAIVATATFVGAPRERRFAIARALVAGAVLCGVLCAPLVGPYTAAARVVGERTADEVKEWSARPADFLRAHPDNAMYGDPARPGTGEKRMFPGAVAPLLGVAALVPPVSTAGIAYMAVGLVSADLSLGFNGVGYGPLYNWVLPFRALRVPARFAMMVGLALAVLAGFGVARLCRGRSSRVQLAIVTIAIALVTLESRPRTLEIAELDDRTPAVYSWLATQEPGVVCEYPVGNLQGRLVPQDATYMYYSTRHWRPLVNGYSGFSPPSYRELIDHLRGFPDDASIAYLRERGVTYLLVHNVFSLAYVRGDFEDFVRRLNMRPDVKPLRVFAWRGGGRTEVFRILR